MLDQTPAVGLEYKQVAKREVRRSRTRRMLIFVMGAM